MQWVYSDHSNSLILKLLIYLRSIQFLLPSKLLYPFNPSILGSSFGFSLRSSFQVWIMAHSGPKLWYIQTSRSLCTFGFRTYFLYYINSPKFHNDFFFFFFFFCIVKLNKWNMLEFRVTRTTFKSELCLRSRQVNLTIIPVTESGPLVVLCSGGSSAAINNCCLLWRAFVSLQCCIF